MIQTLWTTRPFLHLFFFHRVSFQRAAQASKVKEAEKEEEVANQLGFSLQVDRDFGL